MNLFLIWMSLIRKIGIRQPYEGFGVKTGTDFRGMVHGQVLENLYVAGAVLEGFNPIKEGCGGGVSVLSALYVAEQILSK